VYNAVILGGLKAKYIFPQYSKEDNILIGISPEDIDNKLQNDNDIKAVVITYPSFYGICSDIKRIAEVVHKYNKILIVDEAHGSHFTFNDRLPISALQAGADISIQSAHKTLPALTQSSMVHVGSDRVNIEKLESVYAPVGINISSNSVDEIAFGIMAEILLVKNNGSLTHRKNKIK